MDEQATDQPDVIVDAQEIEQESLDNFDTRTPADVEAEQQDAEEEPETNQEEQEAPKAETPNEAPEKPQYQAPKRVQLEAKPFEAEIPVDEYGNVDPAKLGEYLQRFSEHTREQARIEAQQANYDVMYGQREWNDVQGAFPELVKDDHTRSLIENLRVADAIKGGEGSLMAAAEQLDGMLKGAEARGRESQQSVITRQKSVATTGQNRTQNVESTNLKALRNRAIGGSEDARIQYLSKLIDDGALN